MSAEIAKVESTPGPPGSPGRPGPPGRPGTGAVLATVATTGEDGRAVWVFGDPFTAPPAVAATPVDPVPGDIFTVTASIEHVDAAQVVVRVWQTLTPVTPVGPGLLVHLVAVPNG